VLQKKKKKKEEKKGTRVSRSGGVKENNVSLKGRSKRTNAMISIKNNEKEKRDNPTAAPRRSKCHREPSHT